MAHIDKKPQLGAAQVGTASHQMEATQPLGSSVTRRQGAGCRWAAARRMTVFAAALLTVTTFSLLVYAAATSNSPVYYEGIRRGEAWFNRGNPANLYVEDTSCDAMGVWVNYRTRRPGGSWIPPGGEYYSTHDGNGCQPNGITQELGNDFVIEYFTCVDTFPDTCANRVEHDFDPP